MRDRGQRPRHILSASQFDRQFLDYMYELINTIRKIDKSKDGLMYLQSLLPHKRAMVWTRVALMTMLFGVDHNSVLPTL